MINRKQDINWMAGVDPWVLQNARRKSRHWFLSPGPKNTPPGVSDASFWHSMMMDDSFEKIWLQPPAIPEKSIKGGPGSGNFGHAGRPGKRGGSAPRNQGERNQQAEIHEMQFTDMLKWAEQNWTHLPNAKKKAALAHPGWGDAGNVGRATRYRQVFGAFQDKYRRTYNNLYQALNNERIGVSPIVNLNHLKFDDSNFYVANKAISANDLGDLLADVTNSVGVENVGRITIGGTTDGKMIVDVNFITHAEHGYKFTLDGDTLELDYLALPATNGGVGFQIIKNTMDMAAKAGFKQAHLEADISVGKYAWARLGFRLKAPDPTIPDEIWDWLTTKSKTSHTITPAKLNRLFPNGRSDFLAQYGKTLVDAPEIANFSLPGINPGWDDIINNDVPAGLMMHVGKAYMLDRDGFGGWNGYMDLDDYSGKSQKSIGVYASYNNINPSRTSVLVSTKENLPENATDIVFWGGQDRETSAMPAGPVRWADLHLAEHNHPIYPIETLTTLSIACWVTTSNL